MVTSVRFVVSHWGSWRRHSVLKVHDSVALFVTLIASNMRAIECNLSWFLTLETAIIFVWHYIDCGWWDDHCCELLCGIKLLHFWDGVSDHLRPFSIDLHCQTMDIFQSFDENPNSGDIICEVASLCLCFEPMDVCCKGFLFPLLDIHETQGIGMDIYITKLEAFDGVDCFSD